MTSFLLDLRQSFRGLWRTPLATATMVVTLALGIGATTSMFSAVHALLLRPLPYPEPDRLVALHEGRINRTADDRATSPASLASFLDYRASARGFEGLAAFAASTPTFSGPEGPVRMRAGRTTAGFFEVLGVRPAAGRFYERLHETPGEHRVAVLSHRTWHERFGGDPSVVGRAVELDGEAFTVVGVAPAGFVFPFSFRGGEVEVFLPIPSQVAGEGYGVRQFPVVGRLRPGVSRAAAQAELRALAVRLSADHAADSPPWTVDLRGLREDWVGDQARPLVLLMSAVALLLLVACVDVANLLLVRAEGRRREVAIRASLGAGPRQLLSLSLADGLALGLLGGGLGLVAARAGVALLPSVLPRAAEIDHVQELHLDGTVLAFAWLVSLGCSLAFAAAPFLQASRQDLQRVLVEAGRGGPGRTWARSSLVVAQVSLSVVLLAAVGLFLRSFLRVADQPLGFEPSGVAAFGLSLPESRFPDAASRDRLGERLRERLATLPGVAAAGAAYLPPLSGSDAGTGAVPVELSGDPAARVRVSLDAVSPGYVETLRVPLLRGRSFDSRDTRSSRPVVMVNEALARRFYAGADPVGRVLDVAIEQPQEQGDDSGASLWEIVGVLQDTRDRDLERPPRPRVLVPVSQAFAFPGRSYFLRSELPVATLEPAVRQAVAEVDPLLAVGQVRTLEEARGDLVAPRRQTLALLSTFGALALLLTAVGVNGVVALQAASRRREIGTRMAFGARPAQIAAMVMGRGARLVGAGVALGLAGTLALGRLLARELYGVEPTDPVTLAAVCLVLAATALVSTLVPSLRAALVDPAVALRQE